VGHWSNTRSFAFVVIVVVAVVVGIAWAEIGVAAVVGTAVVVAL